MATLLKLIHLVYCFSVSAIVFSVIGLFILLPQLKIDRKITQSCLLPETIDTTITLTFSEEKTFINCEKQDIHVTQNGKLLIKSAESDLKTVPQLRVSSLIVDNGGKLAMDNREDSLPVTLIFTKGDENTYAQISETGNITTINAPSVLGAKTESENFNFIDNIAFQTFECAKSAEYCPKKDSFVASEYPVFPFAIIGKSQETYTKNELTSVNSLESSVLGVSGRALAVGAIIDRSGDIVLSAQIEPKLEISTSQHIQLEFEVKSVAIPYDGVRDIYTSEIKEFDGKSSVVMSAVIQYLEKNASYKWRVRIVNTDTNEKSEWVEYGNSDSSIAAFVTSTAEKLVLTAEKYTVSTQEKFALKVRAVNSDNETDKSFRGIVKFTSDQMSADLPRAYQFRKEDQGEKVFLASAKFYEPGNGFITAADINNTSLTGTIQFTITQKERAVVSLKDTEQEKSTEENQSDICPTIENFTVADPFIKQGVKTSLSWDVKNAERVIIDALPGEVSSTGTASFEVNSSETITIKAINGKCHRSKAVQIMTLSVYPWEGTGGWLVGVLALEIAGGATVLLAASGKRYGIFQVLDSWLSTKAGRKKFGLVYDIDTKRPIVGVTVMIFSHDKRKEIARTQSDNNGFVYVQQLPGGDYTVKIQKLGFQMVKEISEENSDHYFTNHLKDGAFSISEKEKGILPIALKRDSDMMQTVRYHFLLLFEEVITTSQPLVLIVGFFYGASLTIMYPVIMNIVLFAIFSFFAVVKISLYFSEDFKYGVLKTINGVPISGVFLALCERKSGKIIAQARTNRKGQYIFFAPRGSYSIKILDKKYRLLERRSSGNSINLQRGRAGKESFFVSKDLMVYSAKSKNLKGNLKFRDG